MIRLLAFDLDGTTLTEHQYISKENKEALAKAGEKGVFLVPATGRMKTFIPQEITSIPGVRYIITANGAAVYDLQENTTLFENLISNEKAKEVQALLSHYDVYVEYYRKGEGITLFGNPEKAKTYYGFPKSKWHFISKGYHFTESFEALLQETSLCPEKMNLPYLQPQVKAELWEKLTALGGLHLTSSIADNIEINDAGADKGAALQQLRTLLGVSREETAAIGDNGNDVTMLQGAACSIAVADAAPEALAAAVYRTCAHTENGVSKAIWDYIL